MGGRMKQRCCPATRAYSECLAPCSGRRNYVKPLAETHCGPLALARFPLDLLSPAVGLLPCAAILLASLVYRFLVLEQRPTDLLYRPGVAAAAAAAAAAAVGAAPSSSADVFRYPLLSCLDDLDTCCLACWCPGLRAGDTHASVFGNDSECGECSYGGCGGGFWPTVLFFLLAYLMKQFVAGSVPLLLGREAIEPVWPTAELHPSLGLALAAEGLGWLAYAALLAGLMTGRRARLRERLIALREEGGVGTGRGVGGPPRASCLRDCCTWFWCSVCANVQEAREVDAAQGVKVRCCCRVRERWPENSSLVGVAGRGALSSSSTETVQVVGRAMSALGEQQQQQQVGVGVCVVVGQPVAEAVLDESVAVVGRAPLGCPASVSTTTAAAGAKKV